MLHDALEMVGDGPVMIRYPKGAARQVAEHEVGTGLRARRTRTGDGSVCILAIGKMLGAAERAADTLAAAGTPTTVWDVRSCAPLDRDMLADAGSHRVVVTVEDGIREGGIGMTISDLLVSHSAPDTVRPYVEVLGVPTTFIPHAKPDAILKRLGLDAEGIAATVRRLVGA